MKSKMMIAVGIIVLSLFSVLFFSYFSTRQAPAVDNMYEQSEPEPLVEPQTEFPSSPQIPSMIAGEDTLSAYSVVEAGEFSPTTLRSEEVAMEVANTLDGLMRLESEAIEKVSLRTAGGDHNPFRYMLQTALENKEIGDVFRRLASESKYEILHYEVSDDAPNLYTFYINCTTPYIADVLSILTAGAEPKYIQEVSRFAGTGAASEVAKLDLKLLPVSNDIVALTVIVENDVPIIYHPISLNYGNRKPQYAFLWGGAIFSGVLDGDLLIDNTLGHSFEVDRDRFLSVQSNSIVNKFVEASLDAAKMNDCDTIAGLKLMDTALERSVFCERIVPGIASLNEEYPKVLFDRATSLEYSIRYFGFKRSDEDYIPYNTLMVTFSVIDADAGNRVYYHRFISWDSLDDTSRDIIVDNVSDILTAVFLGDQSMLLHRLNLFTNTRPA